ncbi:hypothetical protein LTR94_036013, partial [Friedmanniomyces endolithicus]
RTGLGGRAPDLYGERLQSGDAGQARPGRELGRGRVRPRVSDVGAPVRRPERRLARSGAAGRGGGDGARLRGRLHGRRGRSGRRRRGQGAVDA